MVCVTKSEKSINVILITVSMDTVHLIREIRFCPPVFIYFFFKATLTFEQEISKIIYYSYCVIIIHINTENRQYPGVLVKCVMGRLIQWLNYDFFFHAKLF